jgi:hypothetical protein
VSQTHAANKETSAVRRAAEERLGPYPPSSLCLLYGCVRIRGVIGRERGQPPVAVSQVTPVAVDIEGRAATLALIDDLFLAVLARGQVDRRGVHRGVAESRDRRLAGRRTPAAGDQGARRRPEASNATPDESRAALPCCPTRPAAGVAAAHSPCGSGSVIVGDPVVGGPCAPTTLRHAPSAASRGVAGRTEPRRRVGSHIERLLTASERAGSWRY